MVTRTLNFWTRDINTIILLQFFLGLRCSSLTSNPKRRQSQSELYTTHFDSEDDYRTVVETSVTVKNNSPIQDYVHPDDQTQPTFEMTPRFKSFTLS